MCLPRLGFFTFPMSFHLFLSQRKKGKKSHPSRCTSIKTCSLGIKKKERKEAGPSCSSLRCWLCPKWNLQRILPDSPEAAAASETKGGPPRRELLFPRKPFKLSLIWFRRRKSNFISRGDLLDTDLALFCSRPPCNVRTNIKANKIQRSPLKWPSFVQPFFGH